MRIGLIVVAVGIILLGVVRYFQKHPVEGIAEIVVGILELVAEILASLA